MLNIKKPTKQNVLPAIGVGVCCFAIAFGINAFASQQRLDALELEQVRQNAETMRIQNQVDEHVHTWVPSAATTHHNAVTKDIHHEPIYETSTTYHTVCNQCEKIIDGAAQSHIVDTGHAGYSTNVPIVEEVLKTAGYTEVVVVEDAWDETATDGVICTSCGTKLSSEEATKAGVTIDNG